MKNDIVAALQINAQVCSPQSDIRYKGTSSLASTICLATRHHCRWPVLPGLQIPFHICIQLYWKLSKTIGGNSLEMRLFEPVYQKKENWFQTIRDFLVYY